MVELELKTNLRRVRDAFMAKSPLSDSALWRLVAKDNRFFGRVVEGDGSFTARTYDEVIQRFSDHWPVGAEWPLSVRRPPAQARAAA